MKLHTNFEPRTSGDHDAEIAAWLAYCEQADTNRPSSITLEETLVPEFLGDSYKFIIKLSRFNDDEERWVRRFASSCDIEVRDLAALIDDAEECEQLTEILDVEGFGGAEYSLPVAEVKNLIETKRDLLHTRNENFS